MTRRPIWQELIILGAIILIQGWAYLYFNDEIKIFEPVPKKTVFHNENVELIEPNLIESLEGNTLVLDTRSPSEFALESVKGAYSFTGESDNRNYSIVSLIAKADHVIFYDNGLQDSRAEETASFWSESLGFSHLKIVPDGIKAWQPSMKVIRTISKEQ